MRHWLRNRAAFTRPNFGTAIRMSNTFAVETYSGGALRIVSILTRPSFKSFFNLARLTRMSFALLSASILWSRERAGAWAWAFVDDTIERASLTTSRRRSMRLASGRKKCSETTFVRDATHGVDVGNTECRQLRRKLCAHAVRRVRVREQDRPEGDVLRAGSYELERVTPRRDSAHPDDREACRAPACVHGGECNRL